MARRKREEEEGCGVAGWAILAILVTIAAALFSGASPFTICSGLVALLLVSVGACRAIEEKSKLPPGASAKPDFIPPPDENHRWFARKLRVAGVMYRVDNLNAVATSGNIAVELQREPENPHDRNAIRVMANGLHVGYLPAEVAAEVAEKGIFGELIAYPVEIYRTVDGGGYVFNIAIQCFSAKHRRELAKSAKLASEPPAGEPKKPRRRVKAVAIEEPEPLIVACPKCGADIEVPPELAEQKFACPGCGQHIKMEV